jgi:anti-sigma factor RsiW
MTCPSREELVAVLDAAPLAGAPAARAAGPGRGVEGDALAAVRGHVDGCPACRAELARLEAGLAALRAGSPLVEPSPFFAARLSARLAALPPPRRRGLAGLLGGTPWRLAAAGSLAAALAVGFVLVQRTRTADELAVADRLELLEDLEVVASLGDVDGPDDVAIIAALGDPGAPSPAPPRGAGEVQGETREGRP